MEYSYLGNTNLKVSKICLGSLTVGPLQANLTLNESLKVFLEAFDKGINFIDTAEIYENYDHIKNALKHTNKDIIISTKCYAYTKEMMKNSLEKARKELDRDVIDIFLLHEQESILTVKGHWEAIEYLLEAKEKGLVKAIGISTHHIKGVEACIATPELEIIHAIANYKGIGILDGNIEQMLKALEKAKSLGKGVYSMKPIGGGNLLNNAEKALKWSFNRPEFHSVALGMQSVEEVRVNTSYLKKEVPDTEDLRKVEGKTRSLHIEDYCEGCGNCVERCGQKALKIENGQAVVNRDKCVLCGYCSSVCPLFAIKVV